MTKIVMANLPFFFWKKSVILFILEMCVIISLQKQVKKADV